MELANLYSESEEIPDLVRMASFEDADAILELLRTGSYSHIHADWHVPGDWLGSPGFVVWEHDSGALQARGGFSFHLRKRLQACLVVAADPLPAAWVRVAGLRQLAGGGRRLGVMLERVLPWLRETAVSELAWLPVDPWPNDVLPELGFNQVNGIETYVKYGMAIPKVTAVPGLQIRPVTTAEMEQLAQLEAEAFAPLWRHSAIGLRLAEQEAMSFDVAIVDGDIAGFQFSTLGQFGAHLVRLTVHPNYQGKGVGSALLAHAFRGYQRQGIETVTLNTQLDNTASQRLYRKFGFVASGQRLPVWSLPISST